MRFLKKHFVITCVLLLVYKNNNAQQNLVINPSFEQFGFPCPLSTGGFVDCTNWSSVKASPDYFHTCASSGSGVAVPNNVWGSNMTRTGQAYAGFFTSMLLPCTAPNFRETIQGQLISSLVTGKKYCVEFWVSLSDSCNYAINNIGAYLSDTSYNIADTPYINFQIPFNRTPQIVNDGAVNPLTDKLGWTKVSGSFIAEGGEKYILIGNFNTDANSDTLFVTGGSSQLNMCYGNFSYYYIDDVSVYCCDADSCEDAPVNINVYPNPNNGEFTLQYGFNDEDEAHVIIYNMLGQPVYTANLPCNVYAAKITVPNLATGVYQIGIFKNGQNVFNNKIVIVR